MSKCETLPSTHTIKLEGEVMAFIYDKIADFKKKRKVNNGTIGVAEAVNRIIKEHSDFK